MKDREVFEKYNNPTLFQFFPATNTKILLVGKPRSDMIIKKSSSKQKPKSCFCVLSQVKISLKKKLKFPATNIKHLNTREVSADESRQKENLIS